MIMNHTKKQTQIQRIKILEKVVGKLYMELIELKAKQNELPVEK